MEYKKSVRVDLLFTVVKEISKYKSDLVEVHKVSWTVVAWNQQENTHFLWKGESES
jgi:hypothetical protein